MDLQWLTFDIKPGLFTKKFGHLQGVAQMVAETYLSTLSKPFTGQRSRWGNFEASAKHPNLSYD